MGITRNRLVADPLTSKVRRIIAKCEAEINQNLLDTSGASFNYYLHPLDKLVKTVKLAAIDYLYRRAREAGWYVTFIHYDDKDMEFLAFRGGPRDD
jgi:hypothetical protein